MTVAVGIALLVLGAILYLAADVDAVGLILIIAGGLVIAVGLLQAAIWSRGDRRRKLVADDRPPTDDRSP